MGDALAWREIPLRPPPPRLYGASLTSCPRGLLLFGGSSPDEGTFSSSLFLLDADGMTCTNLHPSGSIPGERHFHAAAFHDGFLYIHGGKSNGYHHDLHRYSLESNSWSTLVPPRPGPAPGAPLARFGHTAVVIDGALYVFGGYDQHGWLLADLYRFDLRDAQWTRVPPTSSPPAALERMHHVAVAYGRTLLVQGGKGEGGAALADVCEYHVDTRAWTRLVCTGPAPARHGHTAVLLPPHHHLLAVFGGADGTRHWSQLHLLDLRTRAWRLLELPHAPAARYFHAAAAAAAAHGMYLYGGKNAHNASFADLYLLAPTSAAPPVLAPQPPAPAATPLLVPSPLSTTSSSPSPLLGTSSDASDGGRDVLRLKCTFNGEIRVLSTSVHDLTYASLTALLAAEYGVEPGALRVQYTDPEGDRITVRSERDLGAALHYAKANLLRLLLSPVSLAAPSSIEMPTPPPSPALLLSAAAPPAPAAVGSSPAASSALPTSIGRRQEVRWVKGPLLDQGAFGAVYLAIDAHTGAPFAVKTLPIGHNVPASAPVALQREIDLLATLSHAHIVRYLGTAVVDAVVHIFMEFVPGGSLASLLRKFRRLPEPLVARYTAQVLAGLTYLHERGIVHRDIKGANVLVDAQGNLKLADFGAAKQLDHVLRPATATNASGSSGDACQTVTGTPYYMAPEGTYATAQTRPLTHAVIQGARHYGRKADVWSLGALMVEMATGAPPFADLPPVAALFRIGSEGTVPPLPPHLTATAHQFLTLCFTRDPRLRPTSKKLQEHAFVATMPLPQMPPAPTPEPLTFVLQSDARLPPAAVPVVLRPSSLSDSSDSAREDDDDSNAPTEQHILEFLQGAQSIVATREFLGRAKGP